MSKHLKNTACGCCVGLRENRLMTIIDNAFQLILFAERNYLVHDSELKSLKWMVDDVNSLREKIDSIENSLKNPHKVKRGIVTGRFRTIT